MKINKIYFFVIAMFFSTNVLKAQEVVTIEYNRIFFEAEQKLGSLADEVGKPTEHPRSINDDGSIRLVTPADWTSGFFPGSLWYMYENTGVERFKTDAINWTNPIESQKDDTGTHDLGFMLYCSFGNGLRLVSPPNYSDILVTTANSLMTRVNPTVKCMKSWDWADQWQYPVIIDNMMNLELLFWASKETGDSKYYDAAVEHANTTIANHFRADNSSYHVVDYDVSDGSVNSKETHQGIDDESDWARGQAWGLYGYTMSYRETNDVAFLEQAEKIASFIFNHPNMPSDLIPYWDLKDPNINTNPNSVPRDASAATVMASALIELSVLADDTKYLVLASKILNTLSQPGYTTDLSSSNNFILLQSTGNLPSPYNPEVNTSINYADYYYLEALTRYKNVMGVDFEPYTIYSDSKIIDAQATFIDDVIIYDIDNIGGFTVSLKNNPSFVSLESLGGNMYTITSTPETSDVGNHVFELTINYNDGTLIKKTISYKVTGTLSGDLVDDFSKSKVYLNRESLVVEGLKNVQQVSIYDTSGTFVLKKKIYSKDDIVYISIPYLNSGLYVYEIETTKGVVKGKIIKD